MDSFINYFFGEKFVVDNRIDDPVANLVVPFGDGFSCGLVLPEPWFMVQLCLILSIQTISAAAIGWAVYNYILIPQMTHAKLKVEMPMSVYIFGYGIIFPLIFREPTYLIDCIGIQNKGLKMLTLGASIQLSLRTLQAMHGFVPPAAKKSLKHFLIFFSCLFDITFDPATQEPKPISFKYMKSQILKVTRDCVIVSCLLSVMLPCEMSFFPTELKPYSNSHGLKDMLAWQHIANNYLAALTLSFCLSQSTLCVSIVYNFVYGYETNEVVLNPMFKASSPSDFWGRRWNNSVHVGLKNGCYKPVRQRFKSKVLGMFASFVVSGILHEFINVHLFDDGPDVKFEWKNMIFFGWNAILIAMEYACSKHRVFHDIGKNLPSFVITMMVISTALPVAHMFTGDWIRGKYFDQVSLGQALLICNRL